MKLNIQRRIVAKLLKCSPKKVWLNPTNSEDIKEAITKKDLRSLIKEGIIKKKKPQESSRVRARKIQVQKSKGKRKGPGSKKGGFHARMTQKERWTLKIRAQRTYLKKLKDEKKITSSVYRNLYNKSKGGFFRSRRHITIYSQEHNLIKNEKT